MREQANLKLDAALKGAEELLVRGGELAASASADCGLDDGAVMTAAIRDVLARLGKVRGKTARVGDTDALQLPV